MPNTDNNGKTSVNEFVKYLHKQYHEDLMVHAFGLCSRYQIDMTHAPDFVQEFYCDTLSKPEKIINGYTKHGLRFLKTVIKNDVRDFLKNKKTGPRRHEFIEQIIQPSGDISHFDFDNCYKKLEAAIDGILNPQDSSIMKLYLSGFSYEEISEKFNMNIKTVGVRIFRAKLKLKGPLRNFSC